MTGPGPQLTANEVSHHLLALARELDALTKALNSEDVELAKREAELKLAEAHATVNAEGPAGEYQNFGVSGPTR